jgi:hypothetical protein
MKKRVLVIHYSQTGQLSEITNKFCAGLEDETIQIDHLEIDEVPAFPFPWNRLAFFNTFPESVFGIPMPIKTSKTTVRRVQKSDSNGLCLGCQKFRDGWS